VHVENVDGGTGKCRVQVDAFHKTIAEEKLGMLPFKNDFRKNNIARVIFFPDSPPYKGSIPSFFPTSENEKKKGLKIMTLFAFRGADIWINPNM
jgi:hypothetical protein